MNFTIQDRDNQLQGNFEQLIIDTTYTNFIEAAVEPRVTFEKFDTEKNLVLFLNILLGKNLNVKWSGYSHDGIFITNETNQSNDSYFSILDIPVPYEAFLKEVEILESKSLFVPHRTKDGYNGISFNKGWYSFCIHGLGFDMTQGPEYYGYNENTAPYKFTNEAILFCPTMVKWFEDNKFKNIYHRVRIMKLAPGGMVGVHNDNSNPRSFATNIAINNPSKCEMHFLNRNYEYLGTVPWRDGSVIKIQIGLTHYVINRSQENRYHFIVHGSGGYI